MTEEVLRTPSLTVAKAIDGGHVVILSPKIVLL